MVVVGRLVEDQAGPQPQIQVVSGLEQTTLRTREHGFGRTALLTPLTVIGSDRVRPTRNQIMVMVLTAD